MTHYNTLNVKLSNLQLNKLKSEIKHGTEVILKLSQNVLGDSDDENDFSHQVPRLRKAFVSNFSANN